jgi:parallel beta-helix repeat protein
VLLATTPAHAKTIEVKPGTGTLQRAVDGAHAGDELVLKGRGSYTGGVVVDKRLTIHGPRKGGLPFVDGRCREAFTMLVVDARVTLRRIHVTGAADNVAGQYGAAEVNFIDGGRGKAAKLKLHESCTGTFYGINVFDTVDVTLTGNTTLGYLDAGIYVGGIRDPETTIEIRRNSVRGNNHGILIEDSLARPQIAIQQNGLYRNFAGSQSAGIYIRNSDGVLIEGNISDENGATGIWLDQNSDFNTLVRNAAWFNGVVDLRNEGDGNCGAENSFPTRSGNPLDAC